MTITRRIALVAAAAVAVTVFVASVAAFFGARSQILGQIDESLVERVELYSQISSFDIPRNGNTSARDPLAGLAALLPRQVRADFDTTYIQIATPRGEINFSANELILPTPESSTLTVGEVDLRSVWVDGVHVRIAALAETQPARIVQVGRPLAEADETLAGLAILLLVGSALGILFAAGLGYVVARSAIKPIGVLEHEITDIASSKTLGGRVEVTGTDEVAQLGLAFNELLDELESAKAQQARLVRDAGHELRTPLTALRTNLEILQRHEVPQEDRARMLESAHAEVEELTELVAEVVDLATDRYDEEPVSTVSLGEVVGAVADRTQRRNGREVEITADDSTVEGKPAALTRAVSNIIANADKWCPPGEPIGVTVANGTVTVTDAGPGFDGDDIDHVFERFYRSSDARATPGSGLGLSIVEQIIEDHGGSVFARNRTDRSGAVVGFSLAVARDPDSNSPAS